MYNCTTICMAALLKKISNEWNMLKILFYLLNLMLFCKRNNLVRPWDVWKIETVRLLSFGLSFGVINNSINAFQRGFAIIDM